MCCGGRAGMGAVEVYSLVVGGDLERWLAAGRAAGTGMLRRERGVRGGDSRCGRHRIID